MAKLLMMVVDGKKFPLSEEGIKQAREWVKGLPQRLREAKNRTTR